MMKKGVKRTIIAAVSLFTLFSIYIAGVIGAQELGPLSKKNWPETELKAKAAVVEHFQREKKMNIEITSTGFSGELLGSEVYIEGHAHHDPQQKIMAVVDSRDGFKVKEASIN